MVKNKKIDNITICGGSWCIDFVNTVKDRVTEPPEDYLSSFQDLLYWAKRLDIVSQKQYLILEAKAANQKKEASLFFKESIAFRETLFELFLAVSKGGKVPAAVMEICNQSFASSLSYIRLAQRQDGFEEAWNFKEDSFKIITAPIINDCYEFLLSEKLRRLKQCPKCGWIFVDTTKNNKRRWCSMKTCGSSVKALEWYYRQKN